MLEPSDLARYERELRAMLRRIGDEDPEGIAELVHLIDRAHGELDTAVAVARIRHGWSWAQLAAPTGLTRQALAQRFGRRYPYTWATDQHLVGNKEKHRLIDRIGRRVARRG
jgi:hypothetical protein